MELKWMKVNTESDRKTVSNTESECAIEEENGFPWNKWNAHPWILDVGWHGFVFIRSFVLAQSMQTKTVIFDRLIGMIAIQHNYAHMDV